MRGLLGQLDRGQLVAQRVDLGGHLVGLSELLLDRLHLLAQEVLALAPVKLGLDLRLDLGAERDHLELAREDLRTAAAAAWRRRAPRVAPASPSVFSRSAPGDHVAEDDRVVDVGDHDLEFLGQIRDLTDDRRERLLHVAHQREQLDALADDVGGRRDLGDEVGLGLNPALTRTR